VTAATVDALGDAAQELLDAALRALALTSAGAPALNYLSYFLPSLDSQCDQAVVYCAGIGEEATQPSSPAPVTGKRAVHGRINLPTLQLLVARCVATGSTNKAGTVYTPPSPAVIGADALKVMQDGWVLWVNLAQQIRTDEWRSRCGDTHFTGFSPLAGQGGLAGWVATFAVALDGFTAA
jgi:hypothetical protein